MPKRLVEAELNPSELYPDPLGRAKGSAIVRPQADIGLAGDIPVSRLLSDIPAAMEREVGREVRREWEEEHHPSAKG